MNKNIEQTKLQKAICQTIVFFAMFDYPLTTFEIWKYSSVKCSFYDILIELENKLSNIQNKNGQYFLNSNTQALYKRNRRYNYTDRKFRQALRISHLFKFIPWIKMIAIGNIIGDHNMKNNGDIDFFIISEKNKIWLTRFFCTLIAKILNKRPQKNKTKDTICLSFYITENNLNLKNLMLNKNDLYFVYWLACLTPIYDTDNYYQKLITTNFWLKDYLPNWQIKQAGPRRTITKKYFKFWKIWNFLFNLLFNNFEKISKKFQLKIMPVKLKTKMNQDKSVIINDTILKLHVNDRRDKFLVL